MDRIYYVEREDATHQTSDRHEAIAIAAEWTRRGYQVDTAVIGIEPDGTPVELAEAA